MANYSGLDLPKYIDVWKVAENILCQVNILKNDII